MSRSLHIAGFRVLPYELARFQRIKSHLGSATDKEALRRIILPTAPGLVDGSPPIRVREVLAIPLTDCELAALEQHHTARADSNYSQTLRALIMLYDLPESDR